MRGGLIYTRLHVRDSHIMHGLRGAAKDLVAQPIAWPTCPGVQTVSLREQVEQRLPNWERWYPSVFDAAIDLGLIKARVCAPSSLLLSNRHSSVRQEAEQAHRDQWGGGPPDIEEAAQQPRARKSAKKRPGKG